MFNHVIDHWDDVLKGALFISFVGHMVNTIPPIENPWGKLIIGGVQWLVGQRQQALLNGKPKE